MSLIPKRLKNEPLIEAIWQVQFESPGAGDVLPGLMYASLKKAHPNLTLHRLPVADIPAMAAQVDPNLRFAAKLRLEEPNGAFIWQIGDRVVTLNCRKPYAGWAAFRAAIVSLIQIIEESGVVSQPQRHSLRYIDLLTLDEAPDVSALQLDLKVGEFEVRNFPIQMRVELPDDHLTHVLQIATPAQVQLQEGVRTGTVVDLETFSTQLTIDWEAVRSEIDTLHDYSKRMFFTHLLRTDAIEKLQPED